MKAKDLRNSILQMAVQGKLVEPDPVGEPASALLERIRAERARLIAEGKIRAPKGGESVIYRDAHGSYYEKRGNGEPVCIDEEIPFEIPESWEWVRLAGVADVQLGKMLDKEKNQGSPKPYLGNVNVQWKHFDLEKVKTMLFRDDELEKFRILPGDLMVCEGGVPGRCAIWDSAEEMYYQKAIHRVRCVENVMAVEYCQIVLELIVNSHVLDDEFTGTTIKHLPARVLEQWKIPLPPFQEQQRIAAYVAELLPLVEEFDALESARERLDAEFPNKLRKSFLQYAMQGKLVKQDPSDEPASALLDRIHEERAGLIKTGGLRASKGGDSVIYRISDGSYYEKRGKGEPRAVEVPFEIPDSWEWVRLGTLFDMQAGKNISAAKISALRDDKHPYPCFGGNGIRGYVESPNRKGSYPIVGRQGALCGCINYAEGEFYATEHAVVTTCFDETDVRWACMALEALNLNQYATSTAQPGLAVSKIIDVLIPVPPAAEQKRIMKKLNQILPHIGGRKEEE